MQATHLELQGKDVWYLGYPMHLTPTELCIMQYLLERNGKADDHALLAHCYADGKASSANLSVRVCAINQKSRTIGGRKILCRTKDGGYKICDDI